MPTNLKPLKSLPPPYILGERFKEKREALGWSIEELAQKTTFSKKQIEQIENGLSSTFYSANIKFNSAKKVAEVLQLSQEIAFEFSDTALTPIHPDPQPSVKQTHQELQEDPSDTLINMSNPAGTQFNHELERTKAHDHLQLKILVVCLLFLGVLFVFHNSDSFSTVIYPKPPEEKPITSPTVTEEPLDINQPPTTGPESVENKAPPQKSN